MVGKKSGKALRDEGRFIKQVMITPWSDRKTNTWTVQAWSAPITTWNYPAGPRSQQSTRRTTTRTCTVETKILRPSLSLELRTSMLTARFVVTT